MATRNRKFKQMYITLEREEAEREELKKEMKDFMEPRSKRLRKLTSSISHTRWYIKKRESKDKS